MKRIAAICVMLTVMTAGQALAWTAWVSGASLNVRVAPDQSSAVLGRLLTGAQVEASDADGIWCSVYLGELTGYVMREYLAGMKTAQAPACTVVSPYGTLTVAMRSRPSNSYATLGILPTGESVELLGEFGEFSCIRVGAAVGFLSRKEIR